MVNAEALGLSRPGIRRGGRGKSSGVVIMYDIFPCFILPRWGTQVRTSLHGALCEITVSMDLPCIHRSVGIQLSTERDGDRSIVTGGFAVRHPASISPRLRWPHYSGRNKHQTLPRSVGCSCSFAPPAYPAACAEPSGFRGDSPFDCPHAGGSGEVLSLCRSFAAGARSCREDSVCRSLVSG